MPSWNIHMAVATELLDYIAYEDRKSFLWGNILPDILNGYSINHPSTKVLHQTTHFYNETTNGLAIPNIIQAQTILSIYKNLNNPYVVGYYIHILTDYIWNYHVLIRQKEIKSPYNGADFNKRKQSDFKNFGNKLIKNYTIILSDIPKEDYQKIPKITPIKENDIKQTIETIQSYQNMETNHTYSYFSQEELNNLFEKTVIILKNVLSHLIDSNKLFL